MASKIAAFMRDEAGATAIEFTFIIALFSMASMAVLSDIGQKLMGTFSGLGYSLAAVAAHH